jgi:hypothetical protein
MLSLALLGLALAMPATDQTVAATATAGVGFGYYPLPDNAVTVGQGFGSITLYPGELRDDDAPVPLQPFLQRAFQLQLYGGGGASNQDGHTTNTFGKAGIDASGYPQDHLYLGAALDLTDTSFPNPYGRSLPSVDQIVLEPSIAAGLRLRDVLFAARWIVPVAKNGAADFEAPFYGGVRLSIDAVIHQRVRLFAHGQSQYGGGSGGGGITGTFGRRGWGTLEVSGGHYQYWDSMRGIDWGEGAISTGWMLSASVGMTVGYQYGWRKIDQSGDETRHLLSLTVFYRVLTGSPRAADPR